MVRVLCVSLSSTLVSQSNEASVYKSIYDIINQHDEEMA